MNLRKSLILLLICALVCSCATRPPRICRYNSADTSLAEAGYSVSRAISSLSETAQAAHPIPCLDPGPSPASYGMAGLVSIEWSGPIEQLVVQLAKVTRYRVRVLGTPPAIPVLVTLNDKNRMVADVLRDVGFQAGRRAAVVVYPDSRVIELRYAKN